MKKKIDSLSASKPAEQPNSKPADTPQGKAAEAPAEQPAKEAPKEEPREEVKEEAKETPATPAATPAEGSTPNSDAAPAPASTPPTEGDGFAELFPEPTVTLGAPPSWLWWIVLLIVSLVLGVVGYALAQKRLSDWLSLEPTASPTATATVTPSATPTPSASASTEPAPTPTATPATIDKAAVTLRVLNGTTTTGAAGKAKATLEAAGFSVRTVGNAKNQNYSSTYIYYQTGRRAEAEAVQAALPDYSSVLEESTLAEPDMVLVVIGAS